MILMNKGAINYAKTGYEVKKMLTGIIEHTKKSDTILIVSKSLTQSDQALSTKAYLNANIGGNRKGVFIEPLIDTALQLGIIEKSDEENFLQMTKGINYKDIGDHTNIRCITFFENTKERFFLRYPEFDTTTYININNGQFLLYVKK